MLWIMECRFKAKTTMASHKGYNVLWQRFVKKKSQRVAKISQRYRNMVLMACHRRLVYDPTAFALK